MQSFIPSRSFPSAMKEGLLALKLRRSPNLLQWMRHLLPSTCIPGAHRLVPPVASNHHRNPPLLSVQARERRKRNPTSGPRTSATRPDPNGSK